MVRVGRSVMLVGLVGLAALAAGPAIAEVYTHAEGGIQFDTPKGWKIEETEGGLSMLSPDETVFAMFLVPAVSSATDLTKVLDVLGSELDKVISDVSYTDEEGSEGTLNGMKAIFVEGTGKVEGAEVSWEVVVVAQKAPVIILTVVQPEGQATHAKAIEAFVKSIKPAGGAAPRAAAGTKPAAGGKPAGGTKPAAGAKPTAPRTNIQAGAKAAVGVPAKGPAAKPGAGKPVAQGGETYVHAEGGIQFVVPKPWQVEQDGDSLSAGPKDGTLSVVFWVLPNADPKNAEAAIEALDTELAKVMTDVEVPGDAEEGNLNGLATLGLGGTGKVDGTEVEFHVVLMAGKKPVMALAMAEPASFAKHQKDWDAFVTSVRRSK